MAPFWDNLRGYPVLVPSPCHSTSSSHGPSQAQWLHCFYIQLHHDASTYQLCKILGSLWSLHCSYTCLFSDLSPFQIYPKHPSFLDLLLLPTMVLIRKSYFLIILMKERMPTWMWAWTVNIYILLTVELNCLASVFSNSFLFSGSWIICSGQREQTVLMQSHNKGDGHVRFPGFLSDFLCASFSSSSSTLVCLNIIIPDATSFTQNIHPFYHNLLSAHLVLPYPLWAGQIFFLYPDKRFSVTEALPFQSWSYIGSRYSVLWSCKKSNWGCSLKQGGNPNKEMSIDMRQKHNWRHLYSQNIQTS